MKRALLILAITLISLMSYSQLSVTKANRVELWKSTQTRSLSMTIDGSDTTYMFSFRKMEYQYINEYGTLFLSGINELNQFLDLCILTIETKEEVSTDKYRISKYMTSAEIHSGGYFWLNKNAIKNIRKKI